MYSQNPYLPHSLRGGTAVLPLPAEIRAAQASDGPPVGTAVNILDWVGEDADRALEALLREHHEDRPRVTLVGQLATLVRKGGLEVPKPEQREVASSVPVDMVEVRAKLGLEN